MAKGFARLGILLALLFINQGARAVSEIMARPAAESDSRKEWLELSYPIDETIYMYDITIGDDRNRQRIETDLLIIPGREILNVAKLPAFDMPRVY